MDRIWFLVVAALMAAPGAAASIGVAETSLQAAETVPSLVDGTVGEAVANGDGLAHALAACRPAIRVPVALVWGDVTAARQRGADIGQVVHLDEIVEARSVPVTQTVTQTVWDPDGLLGFLPPVTREVTRIVGYEDVPVVQSRDVPVEVHVEWQERYIRHGGTWFPILLDLPVGLPFLQNAGSLVQACGADEVLATVPTFEDPGHDVWSVCIGCGEPDPAALDGWYVRVLSAVPRLGGPDTVQSDAGGLAFAAHDVLAAAGLAANGFAPDAPRDPVLPPSGDEAAVTPSAADVGTTPGIAGFSGWAMVAALSTLAAGGWAAYFTLRRHGPS